MPYYPPTFDEDDQMWVPAAAVADLVATVGTADGTLVDVGATFNQGTLNDNFRECQTKLNAILAALRAANIVAED
jgi:uncharacterized tellurite resistance protein B-like protein